MASLITPEMVAEHGITESEYALALDVLVNQHGVHLRSFSDEIWDRIGTISEQVVADTGNSDAMTRRVYDSYLAARNSMRNWDRISEMPYMAQRERVLGG